jgi:hypothetical protein
MANRLVDAGRGRHAAGEELSGALILLFDE